MRLKRAWNSAALLGHKHRTGEALANTRRYDQAIEQYRKHSKSTQTSRLSMKIWRSLTARGWIGKPLRSGERVITDGDSRLQRLLNKRTRGQVTRLLCKRGSIT